MIINKEEFVKAIMSIRTQWDRDKEKCNRVNEYFDTENIVLSYDNSELYKAVILLLRIWFQPDDDGFCPIQHYVYDLNFGRYGFARSLNEDDDNTVITPEDLYDSLIRRNNLR